MLNICFMPFLRWMSPQMSSSRHCFMLYWVNKCKLEGYNSIPKVSYTWQECWNLGSSISVSIFKPELHQTVSLIAFWIIIYLISSLFGSRNHSCHQSAGNNFSLFTGHNYVLSNLSFGWTFYKLLDWTKYWLTAHGRTLIFGSLCLIRMWNWPVIFKIWSDNVGDPLLFLACALHYLYSPFNYVIAYFLNSLEKGLLTGVKVPWCC